MSKSVDVLVAEAREKALTACFTEQCCADCATDEHNRDCTRGKVDAVIAALGYSALVEALAELLEATDPYYEDAAPGEELNGVWAQHFGALSHARVAALKALEAASRVC